MTLDEAVGLRKSKVVGPSNPDYCPNLRISMGKGSFYYCNKFLDEVRSDMPSFPSARGISQIHPINVRNTCIANYRSCDGRFVDSF